MPKITINLELLKSSCFSCIEIDPDAQPQQMTLVIVNKEIASNIHRNIYTSIKASQYCDETSLSKPYELVISKTNDTCIVIGGDLMQAVVLLSCPPEKFINENLYRKIENLLSTGVKETSEKQIDHQQLQTAILPNSNPSDSLRFFSTQPTIEQNLQTKQSIGLSDEDYLSKLFTNGIEAQKAAIVASIIIAESPQLGQKLRQITQQPQGPILQK
jgi:hypothetical protein